MGFRITIRGGRCVGRFASVAALLALCALVGGSWGSADAADLRIKVLSGDGRIESAEQMRARLNTLGYVVEKIDLAPAADFGGVAVFYGSGAREAGERLAGRLGGDAVVRPVTWETEFDLIVVSGRLGRSVMGGEALSRLALTDAAALAPASPAAEMDYRIGPQDVIKVTVWDNEDLSGTFSVTIEGYISYQLLGRIKAAGKSPAELATAITRLLADGFILNPQVTVEVQEYRSQKIFIIGEAVKPGTYYLTKTVTIVEAVSMAGGPAKDADRGVIVVRPRRGSAADAPLLPTATVAAERIAVDLRSALEGDSTQNIVIHSGDSIFIPKAKTFFIMGEVKNPGEYKIESDTTVLKAISVAGGASDTASIGRTRVVRVRDGKEVRTPIGLNDLVQPNDTLIVPESFF